MSFFGGHHSPRHTKNWRTLRSLIVEPSTIQRADGSLLYPVSPKLHHLVAKNARLRGQICITDSPILHLVSRQVCTQVILRLKIQMRKAFAERKPLRVAWSITRFRDASQQREKYILLLWARLREQRVSSITKESPMYSCPKWKNLRRIQLLTYWMNV